jgi:hypothetical protein
MDELMRGTDPPCLMRHFSMIRRDIRGEVYKFARDLAALGHSDSDISQLLEAYIPILVRRSDNGAARWGTQESGETSQAEGARGV